MSRCKPVEQCGLLLRVSLIGLYLEDRQNVLRNAITGVAASPHGNAQPANRMTPAVLLINDDLNPGITIHGERFFRQPFGVMRQPDLRSHGPAGFDLVRIDRVRGRELVLGEV